MQVFIKMLNGYKFPIEIDSTHTILYLKNIICEKKGIGKDIMRLIYNGTTLSDEFTLEKYGCVENGAIIHLIFVLGTE
jgi:hypothetical protein